MWGQNTAYRFIVDYQYSAEVLGYIGVGLGVSSAVFGSIESISMQYFNPIFLKNILDATKERRAKAWNEIAKQIVPIYILAVFFTISMSEVLINILVDKKFHDSYIYTMIGVGIEFFRVMTNLLNNVSQSEYKTTQTIKPYLVGFIVSLGTIYLVDFGTKYYMIPTVLAFAYFCVYVYMYTNMKKLLNIKYDVKILKILLLSIPFFSIYFISIKDFSIISNLVLISIFGLYFLFTIGLLHKNAIQKVEK
jgi:O-antigen/teichoic acid export membrane protein